MTDIEIIEMMINAIERIELEETYNYEGNGETIYSLNTSGAINYLYNEIDVRKSK